MFLPNQKMDQIADLPTITCQNPGNLNNQIPGFSTSHSNPLDHLQISFAANKRL